MLQPHAQNAVHIQSVDDLLWPVQAGSLGCMSGCFCGRQIATKARWKPKWTPCRSMMTLCATTPFGDVPKVVCKCGVASYAWRTQSAQTKPFPLMCLYTNSLTAKYTHLTSKSSSSLPPLPTDTSGLDAISYTTKEWLLAGNVNQIPAKEACHKGAWRRRSRWRTRHDSMSRHSTERRPRSGRSA